MSAVRDPIERPALRDEYFVRRLEAFGDVVIGFSLAFLGSSLIVPNHAAMLLSDPTWLAAYVWTFALVCSMWGGHYWTFRYVFVPTRLSLVLNYAKLGFVVLLIFTVQVLLRAFQSGSARDVVAANELYWGCLCAYWVAAAAILAIGMRVRGKQLAPDVARRCLRRIWRVGTTAPAIVAGIAIARANPSTMASTIALFMTAGVAAGTFAGRLAARTQTVNDPSQVSAR